MRYTHGARHGAIRERGGRGGRAAAAPATIESTREELARAFDLLADARNHVYSVDFYVVDVTLLADSTLGESLRAKLAAGCRRACWRPASCIEQLAREHPETLGRAAAGDRSRHGMRRRRDVSRRAVRSCAFAGGIPGRTRQLARKRRSGIWARLRSLRPVQLGVLAAAAGNADRLGFRGALHAAFDGGRFPQAPSNENALGTARRSANRRPLGHAARRRRGRKPGLKLAERIGDTIAHDHVATVLLAGWPGKRRISTTTCAGAAALRPVLGKLVTLEEYFRITREPDEWTTFYPSEYPLALTRCRPRTQFRRVSTTYRQEVVDNARPTLRRGWLQLHRSNVAKQLCRPPITRTDRDQPLESSLRECSLASIRLQLAPMSAASAADQQPCCLPRCARLRLRDARRKSGDLTTIAACRWPHASQRVLGSGDPAKQPAASSR